ncbi:MAG: TlpA disulfide reductase family protein [Elusimicrobiota bacterium]
MNKTKKSLLLIFVLAGLNFVCGCNPQGSTPEKGGAFSENNSAPDFTLKKLNDDGVLSLSELRGKPVFIDFWATWCPPCRSAMPYVEKLHNLMEDKIHVIGINLDRNPADAEKFLKKNPSEYLQLSGSGTDVGAQYGVRGIPAFFILNREGELVTNYVGFSPQYYEEWVSIIKDKVKR